MVSLPIYSEVSSNCLQRKCIDLKTQRLFSRKAQLNSFHAQPSSRGTTARRSAKNLFQSPFYDWKANEVILNVQSKHSNMVTESC
jgi:hypothetical protein